MGYIGGLYTGIKYIAGKVDDTGQIAILDEFLKTAIDARKTDSIVSIFMMPAEFYTTELTPAVKALQMERPSRLDGYTPRNKKLLTYPFIFCTVDTINDSANYRYEFSKYKDRIEFAMVCAMSPNPEIVTYPKNYNGTDSETDEKFSLNPTESVTCTGFPQCAFSIDAYRAWLAQSAAGDLIGLLGTSISTGASVATGNLVSGALGAVGMAAQANNMILDSTKGAKARGVQGTSTDVGIRLKGIYFKQMSITAEYAKMIDDFFDRFGYATCRIKVPNRNARPHWTYTKTKNVSISGAVPADDMDKIRQIYDNGITFWKKGSELGNYNLDNS